MLPPTDRHATPARRGGATEVARRSTSRSHRAHTEGTRNSTVREYTALAYFTIYRVALIVHTQRVLVTLPRPVHPPYSSVFVTEFNPEYGNTDLLIWLRKRSSPKYGNVHESPKYIFYGNFLR